MTDGLVLNSKKLFARYVAQSKTAPIDRVVPLDYEVSQGKHLVEVGNADALLVANDIWVLSSRSGVTIIEFHPRSDNEKSRYSNGKVLEGAVGAATNYFHYRIERKEAFSQFSTIYQDTVNGDGQVCHTTTVGKVPSESANYLVSRLKKTGFTQASWAALLKEVL